MIDSPALPILSASSLRDTENDTCVETKPTDALLEHVGQKKTVKPLRALRQPTLASLKLAKSIPRPEFDSSTDEEEDKEKEASLANMAAARSATTTPTTMATTTTTTTTSSESPRRKESEFDLPRAPSTSVQESDQRQSGEAKPTGLSAIVQTAPNAENLKKAINALRSQRAKTMEVKRVSVVPVVDLPDSEDQSLTSQSPDENTKTISGVSVLLQEPSRRRSSRIREKSFEVVVPMDTALVNPRPVISANAVGGAEETSGASQLHESPFEWLADNELEEVEMIEDIPAPTSPLTAGKQDLPPTTAQPNVQNAINPVRVVGGDAGTSTVPSRLQPPTAVKRSFETAANKILEDISKKTKLEQTSASTRFVPPAKVAAVAPSRVLAAGPVGPQVGSMMDKKMQAVLARKKEEDARREREMKRIQLERERKEEEARKRREDKRKLLGTKPTVPIVPSIARVRYQFPVSNCEGSYVDV